jgi:hypothetical protein
VTGRDIVDSDSVTSGTRRLRAYAALTVAVGLALLGLVASTLAANTAVTMGETPVTLLPGGRWLAALGLPALAAAQTVTVGLAYGLAARFVPHYRPHIVAAAGVTLLLWGGWQFWVLLALT